ncbi:MAG: hypothetical protein ACOYL5_14845 [Phototrophicaceae bacterium]|jgi:hypothetical protein
MQPENQDIPAYEVDAAHHPCLICGKKTFEWGIISRFTPMTFRRGFQAFRPDPTLGVKARHCLTCGHIQLFVDDELAAEQQRVALIAYGVAFTLGVILAALVANFLR